MSKNQITFQKVIVEQLWQIGRLRLWLAVPVLIGLLLCTACNSRVEGRTHGETFTPLTPPAAPEERVRVARVYDGDTILLEDGRTVRYLGINAPEYRQPFSRKATQLNESLVLGRDIRLEFDQERADSYGRLLAYVYVGDRMVNATLIEEGLAHAFFIGSNRTHNALFLQLQAEARQRKIGIWSSRGRVKDLKITTAHPADPTKDDRYPSYVRIANLSAATIRLADYALSNEAGQQCRISNIGIEPGYTVIVSSGSGEDGVNNRGQLIVYCAALVWDTREDTAFLTDPGGNLVDTFHYQSAPIHRNSPVRRRNRQSSLHGLFKDFTELGAGFREAESVVGGDPVHHPHHLAFQIKKWRPAAALLNSVRLKVRAERLSAIQRLFENPNPFSDAPDRTAHSADHRVVLNELHPIG